MEVTNVFGIGLRKSNKKKSQAIVEFAIVLGVFMLLLLGMVDFGRALNAQITITNASREGARWASLHPDNLDSTGNDPESIQYHVRREAPQLNLNPSSQIQVTFPSGARTPGLPVRVQVQYTIGPTTMLLAPFFGPGGLTLTAFTEMVIE